MRVEKYLVIGTEHMRDGHEDFHRLFDRLEDALECINKDRFAGDNHTYELLKITEVEKIELKQREMKVPQPPVVKKRYIVK